MKQLQSLQLNGNCFDASGEIVEKLHETLDRCAFADVLDSLSDMEDEDESEEDSEDGSGQEDATEIVDDLDDSLVEAFADLAKGMSSALPPENETIPE